MELLDLPNEILEKVITLLPENDRRRTRLVNKRLLDLNNLKTIASDRRLRLRSSKLNNYASPNFRIANCLLIVENTEDVIASGERFWKQSSGDISELIISFKSRYCHNLVRYVCENCPNLEDLTIWLWSYETEDPAIGSAQVLENVLSSNLKSLHLSNMDRKRREPLHPILTSLLTNATSLRRFELKGFPDPDVNLRRHLTPLLNGNLRRLDFGGGPTNEKELQLLFESSNKLTHLSMTSHHMTENNLPGICKNSPNLQSIKILLVHLLLKPIVTCLSALPNLTHVWLCDTAVSSPHKISDVSLGRISLLSHLKYLKISSFFNVDTITDDGLINVFGSRDWPSMRHLHLYGSVITCRSLDRILPKLPNLIALSLNNCQKLGHFFLSSVFTHNRYLKSLELSDSNGFLTLPSLLPNLNNLKQLIHLNLPSYSVGSFSGLRLNKLETLNVSENDFDDKSALEGIFKNCFSLDYVYHGSFDRKIGYNRMLLKGPVRRLKQFDCSNGFN